MYVDGGCWLLRAPLGGPNFLAGLHLPLSLLLGVASTAWRWAIGEILVPLRELESSVALAAGRCSWAPGRGSVACAHGELRAWEGCPRLGQARVRLCPELVAAPRRTRSKTRIGFLKLRITLGPTIASWRRIRRMFWTLSGLLFLQPKAPVQPALAANFHCRTDRLRRSCGARSPPEHCCEPPPHRKGGGDSSTTRQS